MNKLDGRKLKNIAKISKKIKSNEIILNDDYFIIEDEKGILVTKNDFKIQKSLWIPNKEIYEYKEYSINEYSLSSVDDIIEYDNIYPYSIPQIPTIQGTTEYINIEDITLNKISKYMQITSEHIYTHNGFAATQYKNNGSIENIYYFTEKHFKLFKDWKIKKLYIISDTIVQFNINDIEYTYIIKDGENYKADISKLFNGIDTDDEFLVNNEIFKKLIEKGKVAKKLIKNVVYSIDFENENIIIRNLDKDKKGYNIKSKIEMRNKKDYIINYNGEYLELILKNYNDIDDILIYSYSSLSPTYFISDGIKSLILPIRINN